MQPPPTLRKRLLLDIAEMRNEPYPNIRFYLVDDSLKEACLVLTTDQGTIHLTMQFGGAYPLSPPRVRVNGKVFHPNVFNGYICASILNIEEHYTPAYTIKSIAINLLSFFASEHLEQETMFRSSVNIQDWAAGKRETGALGKTYECNHCGLGTSDEGHFDEKGELESTQSLACLSLRDETPIRNRSAVDFSTAGGLQDASGPPINELPDEVLAEILARVNFQDMLRFREAWDRVRRIIDDYQVIRSRELMCFVSKEAYRQVPIGIGVECKRTKLGTFRSEFDLISRQAFVDLRVRTSVHGQPFDYWLPLPLSHGHWRRVKGEAMERLQHMGLKMSAVQPGPPPDNMTVLLTFMNDIVVKLNTDLEALQETSMHYLDLKHMKSSTLLHASEKAIESYFHLFHLLLCVAIEEPKYTDKANNMVNSFLAGRTSKGDTPSIGHLLVALLISDVEMSDTLMAAIIEETITRNVAWLLGKNPELAYIEPDDQVSMYRLTKTFTASLTSYRTLMFSELFRRTARPSDPRPGDADTTANIITKAPLERIRNDLFARHGAPPRGAAEHLASELRRIQSLNSFSQFLAFMGMRSIPGARGLSRLLRDAVRASMDKGYSRWALEQAEALALRREAMGSCAEAEALPEEPLVPLANVAAKLRNVGWFPGRRR